MMEGIDEVLLKERFSRDDIINLLKTTGHEKQALIKKAAQIKEETIGNKVYFRGLIELSNICIKNCFYCGIRSDNREIRRYNLTDNQVVEAAVYAFENDFGSIAIQSGEIVNDMFSKRIERLLKTIHKLTNNELGITLSLGEQTNDVYKRWFDAGAHRYLLRIEASNQSIYKKLHPIDDNHSFENRLQSLINLQNIGYQTGTGVMIGFPNQTLEHLADDLLFIKSMDIDMVGMGPFIEHKQTPLYYLKPYSTSLQQRLDLSIKMISILRLMMNNINIASTTAMQAISSTGRKFALKAGANILMPNITPGVYRENYALYNNKPGLNEEPEDSKVSLENMVKSIGHKVGYKQQGNSMHFRMR